MVRSDLHRWPVDELRRIAAIVRQRKIDVIHTHTSRSNFFGVLLRWFSGVPSVATAHSRHIQLHWMFNDRVIAVSEATRRYQRVHNFVRASRIETIHNFIDYPRLAAVPSDARQRIRRLVGHRRGRAAAGHHRQRHSAQRVDLPGPRAAEDPGGRAGGPPAGRGRRGARQVRGRRAEGRRTMRRGRRDHLDRPSQRRRRNPGRLGPLRASLVGREPAAVGPGGDGRRAWRWWLPPWAAFPSASRPARPACWCRRRESDPLAAAIVELLGDPARRRRFGDAGRRRVQERFTAESQTPSIEAAFARVIRGRVA